MMLQGEPLSLEKSAHSRIIAARFGRLAQLVQSVRFTRERS